MAKKTELVTDEVVEMPLATFEAAGRLTEVFLPHNPLSGVNFDLMIEAARAKQKEIGEKVDPTNIFALRYRDLADLLTEINKLRQERGHDGLPEEN